jgi:uncharacterized protein YjaZ
VSHEQEYYCAFGGIITTALVVMFPETKAVMAGIGGYVLGYKLVESAINIINSRKTTR